MRVELAGRSVVVGGEDRLAIRTRQRGDDPVHIRGLVDRIESLSALTVRARLARAILELAEGSDAESFGLGMTQAALADELGTAREVVVRLLSELRDRGALASAGRARYRIVDRRALELLAG